MSTTRELVLLAQQREVQAIDELYRRYAPRVLAIVRDRMGRRLRLKEQSSDLMQDTLLKMLRELDRFLYQGETAWIAYLATRVEQVIRDKVDYWNAAKRDPTRELPLDLAETSERAEWRTVRNQLTASGIFERNENIQRLRRAMNQLRIDDEDSWDLVRLVRIDGQTYGTVAEMKGITSEAVRKKYYRAWKRLKRYFREVA